MYMSPKAKTKKNDGVGKAGSKTQPKAKTKTEKKNVVKSRFDLTPEIKAGIKDFFVGTFGLGLVGGGIFGSVAFFLLFNIVGIYCTPDSYLLSEKTGILSFSVRLLVIAAFVAGLIFSLVYRNTTERKYRRILLAVFVVELILVGGFILAFETPHCSNFQTLISSKSVARGEISVIDERQVTSDETWDTMAVWSPDSSKIAFLRERSMVDSKDVWIINAGGGNLKQVISASLEIEYPSWSHDGKLIAYAALTSGNRHIWVADVLRGGQKQLTSEKIFGHLSPIWSPVGGEIAYLKVGSHDQDIWVMDVDGENQRQVTRGEADDKSISWSPDGSRIVFVRTDDGLGDIWVVNKDGTGLLQLTSGSFSETKPRFSPDGSQIAFVSRPPPQSASAVVAGETPVNLYDTLWVMNSDGSGVKQLSLDRADGDYSWGPWGDRIVFVKLAENSATLWVVSVDGGHEKMLTLSQPFPTNPAWSPDGSRIVYSVFGTGRRNLWAAILSQ